MFGERSLIYGTERTSTAIANKTSKCWEVPSEIFVNILTDALRKQLVKRIELQDDSISLEDLVYLANLGTGMSSTVLLCGHFKKRALFALKVVRRATIQKFQLEGSLQLEGNLLLEIDHPLIMKVVKRFEDHARVCFLSEYVEGLDLFDVLREQGPLHQSLARFYTACLILILEYLETKQIVYRDLKPENVIVDTEGFPKLVDMGTAKCINGKTYTTIGTPHYMAPEVIVGSGYGISADWWSLGVMVYEFIIGELPFGHELDNPYTIYNAILEGRLNFPMQLKSGKVRSFIEALLTPKAWVRAKGTKKNMKVHGWMSGFDWDSVFSRENTPGFVPKPKNFLETLEKASAGHESMNKYLSTHF